MKRKQSQQTQKEWQTTNKGFLLVEVILSSALFVLLTTALIGAYLYGEQSTAMSGNRVRAIMLAEEGLEAVRNIRDAGFTNLTDGAHGINSAGGIWNFLGTSDTNDIYTRNISISSLDSQHKIATSTITWQQNGQLTGTVILTTSLTDWQRQVNSQAKNLLVNSINATLNPSNNKQIIGITLGNAGASDIVISQMSISWSGGGGGSKVTGISIANTSVWSGSSSQGKMLNIADTTINGSATSTPLSSITFSKNMTGVILNITFTMLDGSATTTSTRPL